MSARAVAALPLELRDRFPASISKPDVLEIFIDKGRFEAHLAEVGIPHPRTVLVQFMSPISLCGR